MVNVDAGCIVLVSKGDGVGDPVVVVVTPRNPKFTYVHVPYWLSLKQLLQRLFYLIYC